MRGKDVNLHFYTSCSRITPAYAGKSLLELVAVVCGRDHPRLCGEKFHKFIFHKLLVGSPPPMRGKVILNHLEPFLRRITPAYAGKSCKCAGDLSNLEDHPRLCGEKFFDFVPQIDPEGSPPPMRGKAEITRTKFDTVGITPAYAGKRKIIPPSSVN